MALHRRIQLPLEIFASSGHCQDDVPFAASMADHARAIGDKCFKEEQFVAAVHCYEVATLLCPSGSLCGLRWPLLNC